MIVVCTMENGGTTRNMGSESIIMQMVLAMKDNGSRTRSMVMVRRPGPMIVTKVSTAMVRCMGEANTSRVTDRCTLVSSLKTIVTVLVSAVGQTVKFITDNGRTMRWMAKAF